MVDLESHDSWNIAYKDPGMALVDEDTTMWLVLDNLDFIVAATFTWGLWFL